MTARDPRNDAFRPPPASWPDPLNVSRLGRLWGLHCRVVANLISAGLLNGTCGDDGRFRVTRAAAEEFARDAVRMREVLVGMTVRHPRWARGEPVRVVEVCLLPDHTHWQIGARTAAGQLVYTKPCLGSRVILRVPPASPSTPAPTSESRKDLA
ncbi:hypothetical protein ACFYUV_38255 [Nonomuraea sp. NPDC003560]|uniref:hypothetical protein n=1 Tax=Nonomuraea sp. NPDC003560 TaxID=3364341 RepID=UPI00367A856C